MDKQIRPSILVFFNLVAALFLSTNAWSATVTVTPVDLNGGNLEPGDVIRYQLSVVTAAGESGTLQVNASFPPVHFNYAAIISRTNVTNARVNGGNAFANRLPPYTTGDISFSYRASANRSITLDIDAVVRADLSSGVSPVAQFVTSGLVSRTITEQSLSLSLPTSAQSLNTAFYLTADNQLVRELPGVAEVRTIAQYSDSNSSYQWSLLNDLKKEMVLNAAAKAVRVNLVLKHIYKTRSNPVHRSGNLGHIRRNHYFQFDIKKNGNVIAAANLYRILIDGVDGSNNGVGEYQFDIPFTTQDLESLTIRPDDSLTLEFYSDLIDENNNAGQPDTMDLYISAASDSSRIELPVANLIQVDQLSVFDSVYGEEERSELSRSNTNNTIYVDATVSSPFGNDYISRALLTLADAQQPAANIVLNGADMSQVQILNSSSSVYSASYFIQNNVAHQGNWDIRVSAQNADASVVASDHKSFEVRQLYPDIRSSRTSLIISDPINDQNNPKAIPGAEVLHTISFSNVGEGETDDNSLIVAESIRGVSQLYLPAFMPQTAPQLYSDGENLSSSGLRFNYISPASLDDDVDFSNDNGVSFDYVPSDSSEYDSNITDFRIRFKGKLRADQEHIPQFNIRYKVKIR